MSKISFCNQGRISLIDITTMGDSSKRDDDSKIGTYDSGLKYAIAICLRNNIDIEIKSGGYTYNFRSELITDYKTSKSKEVIQITHNEDGEYKSLNTAFAKNLGFDWELWMAVREVYSNCLDENGEYFINKDELSNYETIVTMEGENLEPILEEFNNYFISKSEVPVLSEGNVKVYNNPTEHLKLYKNGILVYEDGETKSHYRYDYGYASIDEMRVLNDYGSFTREITRVISRTNNKLFIKSFSSLEINPCYESSFDFYDKLSDEWFEVVHEIFQEKGSFITYHKLYEQIISDRRTKLDERKIDNGFFDRFYGSDYKVEVVNENNETSKNLEQKTLTHTVKDKLKKYGFNCEYEIVLSKISSLKSLADKVRKVIYISEDFDVETDMWQLIKSFIVLESKGDVDYIYKIFANYLKDKHD